MTQLSVRREIGHCFTSQDLPFVYFVTNWVILSLRVQCFLFFFGLGSVDMLAERIDSGIQQTVNPVVEQLSNKAHNVRESLGIWNRPFSPLSSGHPNPVAAPNTNVQSQNEGNISSE